MALPDKPITRREMYYSNMAGQNTPLPAKHGDNTLAV